MACAADESLSDEEPVGGQSARRKSWDHTKSPISDSGSDSEAEVDQTSPSMVQETQRPRVPSCRSSERIRKKQRRQFRMPERKQLFERIPSTKSPGKSHTHLLPKKSSVNDFTRDTHRYNYEPACSSEGSSLDDFIDDDSSSGDTAGSVSASGSGSEPTPQKRRTNHKVIKARSKSRRAPASSSSTSDGSDTEITARSSSNHQCKRRNRVESSCSSEEGEGTIKVTRNRKRQNSSRIDTDSTESKQDAESQGQKSDSDGDSDAAKMNQNISMFRRRRSETLGSSSASEPGAYAGEDSNTKKRAASERAQVMAGQRQAKRNRLAELKATRGRKEESSSDSSAGEAAGSFIQDDADDWLPGINGKYYRGYGRCSKCDRRGHWASGCPLYEDTDRP